MFTGIYSYFSRTDQQQTDIISSKNEHTVIDALGFDLQYRGTCQLIKGKADIDLDTLSNITPNKFVNITKNAQIYLNNGSDWDLIRIENRDSLSTGKFTIISNNPESNAIIDWLIIAERNIVEIKVEPKIESPQVENPKPKPKEVKKEVPVVGNLQRDLLKELMQKMNTKTLENKPIIVNSQDKEVKNKKKEKSKFQKELKERKNNIMNRRK